MNAAAAVMLEDFYKTLINKNVSERCANIVMKLTVIITGCICVGLVFVVEKMGAVLQITMSLSAIAGGPSLGLISMGVLLPWVNSKVSLRYLFQQSKPLMHFAGCFVRWSNWFIIHGLVIVKSTSSYSFR